MATATENIDHFNNNHKKIPTNTDHNNDWHLSHADDIYQHRLKSKSESTSV
jgi:hypothetical protein